MFLDFWVSKATGKAACKQRELLSLSWDRISEIEDSAKVTSGYIPIREDCQMNAKTGSPIRLRKLIALPLLMVLLATSSVLVSCQAGEEVEEEVEEVPEEEAEPEAE